MTTYRRSSTVEQYITEEIIRARKKEPLFLATKIAQTLFIRDKAVFEMVPKFCKIMRYRDKKHVGHFYWKCFYWKRVIGKMREIDLKNF